MTDRPPPAIETILRSSASTTVYVAEMRTGGRGVVKRLREDAVSDVLGAARFSREQHLLRVLRHPGLPLLADSGEDWFATGYIGNSLVQPGERERILSSGGVLALLGRLIETIAYIHSRGVVHMDIKPGHILLLGDAPVLIDFGIAALSFDDPLSRAEVAGSPAWMAREQAIGAAAAPSADIWCFGLVGMWLLTGVRPYAGSAEDILARRRADAAPTLDWPAAEAAGGRPLCDALRLCLGHPGSRPDAASLCALFN